MYFGFYRLLISHIYVFLERHLKKLQHMMALICHKFLRTEKAKSDKKEWGNGELRG